MDACFHPGDYGDSALSWHACIPITLTVSTLRSQLVASVAVLLLKCVVPLAGLEPAQCFHRLIF
jgi:hypothetical protein